MKKLLSLAAIALSLTLVGCSKGYKVSGTIEGANDGDQVLILSLGEGRLDTLHTLTVQNGKFEATGVVDSILFAIIDYQGGGSQQKSGSFFLDNANIKVAFTADEEMPNISGTLINERNTELSRAAATLSQEVEKIFANISNDSTQDQAEAQAKFEEVNQRMEALYRDFVKENIDNFAGQFYLANFSSAFDDDFIKEQLKAIPEGKASYVVRDLMADLDLKSKTAVGQPFVDFSAETPDGTKLSVSDVAKEAKVLMIDFWASWCGPCRAEMPNVKAAYEKYHAQGFEILGVSLDEDGDKWGEAIDELGMTWPQISDLSGWQCEGAGLYGVQAIPATVFIKDGKIVARDVRGEALVPKIEELLK